MNKYSLSALVAAGMLVGGLSTGSASAADLGGNCCADLEERIAELEATTARKGNRKVSLTVSGWVGQQVMWWDDGVESNTYVTGLGSTLNSHFKFSGQAQISPGWSAGYVIHVEANDSDSLTINQDSQHNGSALGANGAYAVQLLQSYWFIKSDRLGKIGVGLQSSASDNAAILVDGSGSLVPANWVMFDYNNFNVRTSAGGNTGFQWGSLAGNCFGGGGTGGDCFGAPRDSVRYDSPTFGGFSVSASWGEDDFWDVSARYSGEFNGFKLAAAVAYSQYAQDFFTMGFNGGPAVVAPDNRWVDYFQLGAYVEHVPTGLWLYGAYGHVDPNGNTRDATGAFTNTARSSGDTYYIKGGLRERWTPLGHTVLYGEYEKFSRGNTDAMVNAGLTASSHLWGLGVVQEIDAAAMSLWISYRHITADVNDVVNNTSIGTDDFQYVKAGALINF
ncbi:porin [Hyphomicrobium sulfonivorans]|uniref:porin n=1 Tax=Hyphomicrobium sulfonivorans TaxID=121290 RepID=UPI00156D48B3|nr:porin [Hyphomicrobium sulfonivorans]MBI1650687.1 porin [Hyphomicrobium sulfonivorans]NSL71956.1 porin [Hyphomicrobium sulfonivorans]